MARLAVAASVNRFPNEKELVRLQRLKGVETAFANAYRRQVLKVTIWTRPEWEFLFRSGVIDAVTYQAGRCGDADH
jgi:hypothetical protein